MSHLLHNQKLDMEPNEPKPNNLKFFSHTTLHFFSHTQLNFSSHTT